MTWTQTLRERWWLAPIAILAVAAAIVIRIITTPLEVSANVTDGERSVPRTATIDLRFNQDMKPDSVQHAFTISPAVLVGFKTVSPRDFQFRPKMAPNTAYHVSVKDAQNTSGRRVSSGFSFKTEPAPAVAMVEVDNKKVADGQQALKPTGSVKVDFTQPMDGAKTPIQLNGKPFDSKNISWSSDGKSATLDLKLGHSRQYQFLIAQAAVNRKQDPLAADWKFSFTTVIQVPSQGDPARIGSGAPAIIQIENSIDARPQAGMQQADMIYEYISEGSIPRLSAVYWHPVPDHGALWQYDPGSKQYLKTQDGSPFVNVGTGRVHAKTVIVEHVNSYLDTNPTNSFHGYYTEAYELTGDGAADIYVDGVVIHGTWHHPDPNVPAVYLDANGNPIDLDSGLTWVHVIGSEKWHLP